jgi:hypothetical protein
MKSQLEQHVRSALHTKNKQLSSALNTDAAISDLKKRILQGYAQLDGVRDHPTVKFQIPDFRSFFGKVLQATYSRAVKHFENIICLSALKKPWKA